MMFKKHGKNSRSLATASVFVTTLAASVVFVGCGTTTRGQPRPIVKNGAPVEDTEGPNGSKGGPTASVPNPSEVVPVPAPGLSTQTGQGDGAQQGNTPPVSAVRTSPLGAQYAFNDVSCTTGALTRLARLENQLNSVAGVRVRAHLPGINTLSSDEVVVRRQHKWTIKQTVAVRETTLLVQTGGKVLKFKVDKNFDVSTPAAGRMKLVHGLYERQSVQDVNIQPVLDLLAKMVFDAQFDSALPSELRSWMGEAREWFQSNVAPTLNSALVRSVVNHLQEAYRAEEFVNWSFQGDTLVLSGTRLRIPGVGFSNQLSVYDQTMCGLGGEAKRTFRSLAVDH